MAVSGLIMIGYLLAHMYGNLKIFAGPEAFNGYAHHLRTLGEPILPHTGLLWIIRVVLLVAIGVHALSALALWARANKARGGARRYETKRARGGVQRTYASFTLRWGGLIILLFVVYHLLHLTFNTIHPGGASAEPYTRVVNGFQIPWVVIAYTIAWALLTSRLNSTSLNCSASARIVTSPISTCTTTAANCGSFSSSATSS